jgi:hypothetical protein
MGQVLVSSWGGLELSDYLVLLRPLPYHVQATKDAMFAL